jgi:hypothetical protein
MVEPMESVRLSATVNGVTSEVHGVSAYHCTNWHLFTVIGSRMSPEPSERFIASVYPE